MARNPVNGLEYPFYYVTADVWNAKKEEYGRTIIAEKQTYEEAISVVRNTPVNKDVPQLEVFEDTNYDVETVAIKVAVTDNPSGYDFYDPRTDENIA